jgi:hypothetical protein
MKNLVEQLNAEIKKAFENGDYHIAEIDSNGFIKIQFEGMPNKVAILLGKGECDMFMPLGGYVRYIMGAYDNLIEKLILFEKVKKQATIQELETKLQALKGGNNE